MPKYGFIFRFHPDETEFPCSAEDAYAATNPSLNPSIATAGVYATAAYTITRDNIAYRAIKYTLVYATNPGIRLANYGPRLGYHVRDTEFVTVLSDYESGLPKWIYMSAHSAKEGTWRRWESMEISTMNEVHAMHAEARTTIYNSPADEYVNIYVALGSHAMYPSAGNKLRILGLANDRCSAKGMKWVVDRILTATADLDNMIPPGGTRIISMPALSHQTWTHAQRFYMPIVDFLTK